MNTTTSPPFGLALIEFFEKLKQQHINFCVLGGYSGLPETITASDVDIIFSRKQLSKVATTLKSVFQTNGFTYCSVHIFKGRHTYIFYFQGDDNIISASLKIDLFVNFEFRGRNFLSSVDILKACRPYKNFFIPSLAHKIFMVLIKGIMKGGTSWKKYLPKIQDGLQNHTPEIEVLLSSFFKAPTVNFLISNLSKGRVDKIDAMRKSLILETYTQSLFKYPIRFIFNLIGHYGIAGGRILRPPRYMVALLGPDGVGKSTMINHIKSDLIDILKVDFDKSKSFHIRPKLFPTITQIFKSKGISDEKPTRSYKAWQSSSPFISFCRLFFFWVDYVLGYIIKILPELNNYNVVILDRYYYDILIDPSRYKINLPYRILKAFYFLLPRPEVVFFLKAPPETIRQRKQELTIPQIQRLLKKYKNLTSEFNNVCIMDASMSPDKISKEIVSIFLKRVAYKLQ
jgi:thymidylate kinase